MELTEMFRALQPTKADPYYSAFITFAKIAHILGHKPLKFKRSIVS